MRGYDYSTENIYFITVCTKNKSCLFGFPEERNRCREAAEQGILELAGHCPGIRVEKHVVMPNHVHMLLRQFTDAPQLPQIIGSYKSYVSRIIHKTDPKLTVWQTSFHDHVVRDQKGYQNIWNYIDANPMNWEKDCFYI